MSVAHLGAIVEEHAHGPVRQLEGQSVLVGVVDPLGDEEGRVVLDEAGVEAGPQALGRRREALLERPAHEQALGRADQGDRALLAGRTQRLLLARLQAQHAADPLPEARQLRQPPARQPVRHLLLLRLGLLAVLGLLRLGLRGRLTVRLDLLLVRAHLHFFFNYYVDRASNFYFYSALLLK